MARAAGLILVDTKYEFGLIDGKMVLIDEIHTPDSSRYWTLDVVSAADPSAPKNFDKEFLREWYAAQRLSRRWRAAGDAGRDHGAGGRALYLARMNA